MKYDHFHFIGIGGIGMSACARILLEKGKSVSGSDEKESSLLQQLRALGANIHIGHNKNNISKGVVIYSTAVSKNNEELIEAQKNNIPILHRSELLDLLMVEKKKLLITGTHGKTTTTALLSWVLSKANLDPSFVVGGILSSIDKNASFGNGPYFVAEADESDGSFLKTNPFAAIITNCEKEHLDYWKNFSSLQKGFIDFATNIESDLLFWCGDDPCLKSFNLKGYSYGFGKENQIKISNFTTTVLGISFDLSFLGSVYEKINLSLYGAHNALNAAAVFAMCRCLKIDQETIYNAFASFPGVKRRLEKRHEAYSISLFDDYAHHPTEIKATLKALKQKFPNRRIVCYFQPHRYSRFIDLFDEFTACFEDADLLFISDIYAASEKNSNNAISCDLVQAIRKKTHQEAYFAEDSTYAQKIAGYLRPFDVLLTMGAGSITDRGMPIISQYKNNPSKWKVAVLYGGMSEEHDISIKSAKNIIQALDPLYFDSTIMHVCKEGFFSKKGKDSNHKVDDQTLEKLNAVDVVIPVFHGPFGEDGTMQGFLEILGKPYVGCDTEASALCMNKAWTKLVVQSHAIPIVPFEEKYRVDFLKNPDLFIQQIEQKFYYPLWIKPSHLGSSIGISRVENVNQLLKALNLAFALDEYILVEKEIQGQEIEFAVLGNTEITCATACEVLTCGSFYDFEKKYGSNAAAVQVPALISKESAAIGQELALKAYKVTHCKGLARVDFFLSSNGEYYFNEINTFPGFTENSAYPKMWQHLGLNSSELINQLVILAFAKNRAIGKLQKVSKI